MAVRARLTPPKQAKEHWNWHTVQSASLPASLLFSGDRRMEAGSFLADGFATRLAIRARSTGWVPLIEVAKTWQPSRLKGTLVSPEFGTPFLAATQVFDQRPMPRKWLSLEKTENATERFVKPSTILLTCSGTVGRATLAQAGVTNVLISHDLLRIEPNDPKNWGWIYAYLRAPMIINLMQSAHYGHVIKHLEVSHLDSIPLITVNDDLCRWFNQQARQIFEYRNRAEELSAEAEAHLTSAFDLFNVSNNEKAYSTVGASALFSGRRRLEANFHAANVEALLTRVNTKANKVENLGALVERVWWMTRFSRNFGDDGTPYMSSDELFATSQIGVKRIYTDPIPNAKDFFVKEGWILMACSGQIYGLNGSVTLSTKHDEKFFFSHDLIRIAPQSNSVRSGYLFAYLGHPKLGQILVKRSAYGSSIPHIDPSDVESIPVGRLPEALENQIADLAEEASRLRAEAAHIERQIGVEADDIIRKFIS